MTILLTGASGFLGRHALTELAGRDGLTRAQVTALSRPLSMRGDRLPRLGFVPQTDWRAALDQAIAWYAEK